MKLSQENVLKLEHPNEYSCIVFHYRVNHSTLLVQARPKNPGHLKSFYIAFDGVEYYEGPFVWGSANVSIATDDEFKDFLTKLGLPDLDLYLKYNRLFIIEQAIVNIKFIAVPSFTKMENLSREFAWLKSKS